MRAKAALLQLTLLVLTLNSLAQTSAPVEPSASSAVSLPASNETSAPPTASIRVTTRMVLLDVLVTDNHDKFVDGLTADQFSVAEDGVPQKIVFFSASNAGKQGTAAEAPHKQETAVFTNRPDPSGSGSVVLILLDGVNTAVTDQIYARQQALRFLRTQLKAEQKVAVFALTSELLLLQDSTDRSDLLLKAIESFTPTKSHTMSQGEPFTVSPAVAAAMSPRALEALMRFNQERAADSISDRVRITQAALRGIARSMIGRPGRKSLIWISSGVPSALLMQGEYFGLSRDYQEEIRKTSALLLQAQIAVYPVDVRGLVAQPQELPNDELVPTVESQSSPFEANDITHNNLQIDAAHAAMDELANETGGHASYNANDLSRAIARAVSESGSYYTLGYYPTNKDWNGKFRKLKTRVSRSGITLRMRRGYYAFDPAQQEPKEASARVAELSAAIVDPLPSTGVLFSAKVTPVSPASYGVDLLIDPDTISFEPDAKGQLSCVLDMSASTMSSLGKFNRVTQTMTAHVPPAQYSTVREKGLSLHIQVHSIEKETSIRLAVRDSRSGLMGTLAIPLPLEAARN